MVSGRHLKAEVSEHELSLLLGSESAQGWAGCVPHPLFLSEDLVMSLRTDDCTEVQTVQHVSCQCEGISRRAWADYQPHNSVSLDKLISKLLTAHLSLQG